ncbi:hypothetical protein AB4043_14275 [Terriglobus sp. YAF25]|uniref:hypothetical protein n=1 Tax=Terriglobus sp. YAF25 TaxID=3233080 RepID=UPI003F9ABD0B
MSDFNSNYTPPPDIHIPAFDSSAQSAFQANTQVPSFDPSTQASVPAFPTFDPSMQAPFPDSGTFSTFDPSTQAPFPDNGTFPNFDPSTQGPAPDAGTFSPFDPSTQGFSSSDPGMSFPQDNFSSPGPDPSFPFDPGFAPPDYDNSATFDSGLAPIPDFYGPPDMGTTLPDPPPFDAESGGQTFSFEPVASVPLDFDQKTMGPPSFDLPPTDLTLGMDTATATYTDVRVDDFLTAFHEASFGPPSFDEPQPGDPNNAVESAAVSTVEPGKSAEPVADTSARLDTAAASTTDSNATQTPETGGSSNSSASADGGVTQSAGGNESGAAAKSEAGNSGMTEFRVWPGGQYERADGSAYDYQASQSFVQNGETYYQNVEVRPDGTVVVHEYRGSEGFNIEHTSVTPGPDAGPPVPGAGTQAPDTSQAPASPEAKPDHDKSVDSGGLGPTLQAIDHFLVPRADEHPFARGVMDNLYKRGEGIASDPAALFGFRPDKTLLGFAQSFITLGKAADDVYYYMMHPDSQEGERKLGSAVVDGAFETPNVIGVAEGAFGALGGGAGVAAAEAGAGAGKPSGEGTPSGLAEPKEATPPSKGEGPAAAETAPPREAPVAAEPVAPPAQEGGGEPPATAGGSEQNPAPAAAEPQGQPPAEPPAEPRASEEPAEPHNSEPEPHDAEPEPHDAEPEPHDAESEPHDAESEPHDAESEPHDAEPEPHDAESEPSSAEPEPNSAEPEPNSAEPEPNSAEPGPNSAEPEPQQAEPEPHGRRRFSYIE